MQRNLPVSAGLSMLLASIVPPEVAPAPTIVWISSTNKIAFGCASRFFTTAFKRSSKSPRKRVPASNAPMSSEYNSAPINFCGTSFATIFCARPSRIAVLPTPGSPTKIGLFLLRRTNTCNTRVNSALRPITGSSSPFSALVVRFVQYASSGFCATPGASSLPRSGPLSELELPASPVLVPAGSAPLEIAPVMSTRDSPNDSSKLYTLD